MGNAVTHDPISDEEKENVLKNNVTVQEIAKYIRSGRAQKICVMTGAGISVSAGIPDFRTPGTGLYDNLAKYNLPKPESMFDMEYFNEDPTAFYDLARELLPSNFKPTPMHYFIKLLEEKNLLQRCYTQNIDTLERLAGVSAEKLVEAHGSFGSAFCTECKKEYSSEYFRDKVTNMTDGIVNSKGEKIPWCKCTTTVNDPETGKCNMACNGNVKPSIVFFGEGLPSRYFELREDDLRNCDLLIVAGTSLQVTPFCDTMHYCNLKAPRLLINKEKVGLPHFSSAEQGFQFNRVDNYRDAALLGTCDEGVWILCELLGWQEELNALMLADNPEWKSPVSLQDDEIQNKITFNYRNDIGNPDYVYDEEDDDSDESKGLDKYGDLYVPTYTSDDEGTSVDNEQLEKIEQSKNEDGDVKNITQTIKGNLKIKEND